MSIESLSDLVSQRLEEDDGCFWAIDAEPPNHARVRFALNPAINNPAILDFGSDAFTLQLAEDFLITEYEYTEAEQPEIVQTLLGRGLDYLHGRCTETEDVREGVRLSKTITFPDGQATTVLWLSPWQRLLWRLMGRRPRNRTRPGPYSYTSYPEEHDAES
jgi:hypothetical protein